jgi:hypothetical protein
MRPAIDFTQLSCDLDAAIAALPEQGCVIEDDELRLECQAIALILIQAKERVNNLRRRLAAEAAAEDSPFPMTSGGDPAEGCPDPAPSATR